MQRYPFSTIPWSPRRTVAVAMSGGIDSSVAAMLLQRQGFDVVGVYMRNWDPVDEEGGDICTQDRDFEDMQEACAKLNIKRVHEV